jgi:hypothetical protein
MPVDGQRHEAAEAQSAVKRYLRTVYDVAVGRKRVQAPNGGRLIFARGFYNKWEQGLRAYGLILSERQGLPSDFMLKGSITEPLTPSATQISSGESAGRYRLSDGEEVVPGVLYFKGLDERPVAKSAPTAPSPDAALAVSVDFAEMSPSNVYSIFLSMRAQGLWADMFDLIDYDSQHQMMAALKQYLRPKMPNAQARNRLDAMSGKELFTLLGKSSVQYTTEIVSEEIHGDKASVHTRIYKDGIYTPSTVNMSRVKGGEWKLHWQLE